MTASYSMTVQSAIDTFLKSKEVPKLLAAANRAAATLGSLEEHRGFRNTLFKVVNAYYQTGEFQLLLGLWQRYGCCTKLPFCHPAVQQVLRAAIY
jgi:hypothetical protein